jgi:glycosyltransferase involved in cell wall biosynthesis
MRLAFITSLVPSAKPETGFEIANAAILEALRAAGHEVISIGFMRAGETPQDPDHAVIIDRIEIENAGASPWRKLTWLGAALMRGLPVPSVKLWLNGRGRYAEAVRKAGPFDAMIINGAMVPGALPEIMDIAPFGLIAHNVEHVSARQNAGNTGNPLLRRLFAREARLLETIEQAACAKARFVWLLAEEDRRAFGAALDGKSAVLPLVSTSAAPVAAADVPAAYDVGLIGTWTWAPNYTGLDWFLREVCPHLPADISVGVAGRLPAEIAGLPDNIKMLGRVPDAGAFLGSCRAIALTSRAGTGVQLKTIEAFQLGKPAVATPLSLRGFADIPGNVRIADDGPAFAAALVRLVADVRAGRVGPGDGAAFMASQREQMQGVIAQGLARISA